MSSPIYSVSALVRYIKSTLDNDMNLQAVFIKGEISNFTNHRSGHWYFTLKDAKARISCVMFSTYASRCPFLLKEGMKVMITASVSMYEAAGTTQLYVTKVQADGIGDLFLQYEQTKATLLSEGLFENQHKKPLPEYPMSIGVITAKSGAAVQDILTTIARRWPLADVAVYPCLVQGVTASKMIVDTIHQADQIGHDVILLARGGGSLEDLWCFNDEILARTIFDMKTVIVTGVGHETDTTLVDYVSDARAPTPTAAAELITPDMLEVQQQIQMIKGRMLQAMRLIDQDYRNTLVRHQNHRYLKDPMSFVDSLRLQLVMHQKSLSVVEKETKQYAYQLQLRGRQLAYQGGQLIQKAQQDCESKQRRLTEEMMMQERNLQERMVHVSTLLDAFSPLKILKRGYSVVTKDTIIKSVRELQTSDQITLRFTDGLATATVNEIKEDTHE